MAGDPNRKRRRRKLAAELGAAGPDPLLAAEVRGMSDEELQREYERGVVAAEKAEADATWEREHAPKNPLLRDLAKELRGMTDQELLAEHAASLGQMTEAERAAMRPPELPTREPEPEPPVEPHPIQLVEPTPPAPPETPRQKWEREQHEKIMAAIAEDRADGERIAREAHAMRDVGTYEGPMLGEMLQGEGQ